MKIKLLALGFVSALYLFSSGQVSYAGTPGNSKWLNNNGTTLSFPTAGPVSGSPAVAPGGSPIYVTSEDGYLYAIDPATGLAPTGWTPPYLGNLPSEGNSASGGYEFIASPAVACDGTIYVATTGQLLYSINPSGLINWWVQVTQRPNSACAVAIGANETVYVTYDDDPYLYSVTNLSTTSPTVSALLDLTTIFPNRLVLVDSPPTVGPDGTIYFYVNSGDGIIPRNEYLVAVQDNGNSGTVKWIVNLGFQGDDQNDFTSTLVVDNSGKIYAPYSLGNLDSTCLQAFKTSDGAPVWSLPFSTPTGAAIHSSPALATNGTVYIGANDGVLYAINTNGTMKWQFDTQTGAPIRSSPAVASDGTIVFGAANGLYAVKDNGTAPTQPSWTFPLSQQVDSSPLIMGSDNAIYFGCADDNVYAVYGSAPLAASGWPIFGGNIQRMAHQGLPSTICCPDTLSVVTKYPPTIYKGGIPSSTSFTISRRYPGPALTLNFYLGGAGSAQPSDNTIYAQYPQDFTVSGCSTVPAPNVFSAVIPSGQTSVTIGVTAVNGNHISNSQWLILALIGQSCVTTDPNAYQALVFIDDPNGVPPQN